MHEFPNNFNYIGTNRPIGIEWSRRNLEVQGTIPKDIQGAFFRVVPDPAFPPLHPDDNNLSHDGMVSRFLFDNGSVDHDIKYVRTARYEAERKARRPLFGLYRNQYTDLPEVQGIDRTVSNITPIWHAGRLLMAKEDALPYEINPHTLETVGRYDFGGQLRSQTMTAHPRIDPKTGEMYFFGYESGGLCTDDVAFCIADRDGKLIHEEWFKQPYISTVHDFAITERYVLFPLFPTLTNLERVKAGGAHWLHEQDKDSWLGVMPRGGSVKQMRWFKGPKGVSAYHFVNAFDEGQTVHVDICLGSTNAFPFKHRPEDHYDPRNLRGALTRWSVDLSKKGAGLQQQVIGPPGELPRLRDADQGRPYTHAWLPSYDPKVGPPVIGGPVGTSFNSVLRVDVAKGAVEQLHFGPGHAFNEPVHVPSTRPGHDGWLLVVMDRELDPLHHESVLLVLDATNITAPPVASVKMPMPLRAQVHGWWVPADKLAGAKASEKRG